MLSKTASWDGLLDWNDGSIILAQALLPNTDALAEIAGDLVRRVLPTDLQSNDEPRLNEQLASIADAVDNEDYWGAAEQGFVGMLDIASRVGRRNPIYRILRYVVADGVRINFHQRFSDAINSFGPVSDALENAPVIASLLRNRVNNLDVDVILDRLAPGSPH